MAKSFNACVVLGTAADVQLSPQSQDSRVLSITLLLRHLVAMRRQEQGCKTRTHIVSENRIDQTALLALTPRESQAMRAEDGRYSHLPDFINTQAIIARALAQAVAYPEMQSAVGELFDDAEGSSCIVLVYAESRIPSLDHEIPFGVAKFLTRGEKGKGYRDTCVGYITKEGDMNLGPSLSNMHKYVEGDR